MRPDAEMACATDDDDRAEWLRGWRRTLRIWAVLAALGLLAAGTRWVLA